MTNYLKKKRKSGLQTSETWVRRHKSLKKIAFRPQLGSESKAKITGLLTESSVSNPVSYYP